MYSLFHRGHTNALSILGSFQRSQWASIFPFVEAARKHPSFNWHAWEINRLHSLFLRLLVRVIFDTPLYKCVHLTTIIKCIVTSPITNWDSRITQLLSILKKNRCCEVGPWNLHNLGLSIPSPTTFFYKHFHSVFGILLYAISVLWHQLRWLGCL